MYLFFFFFGHHVLNSLYIIYPFYPPFPLLYQCSSLFRSIMHYQQQKVCVVLYIQIQFVFSFAGEGEWGSREGKRSKSIHPAVFSPFFSRDGKAPSHERRRHLLLLLILFLLFLLAPHLSTSIQRTLPQVQQRINKKKLPKTPKPYAYPLTLMSPSRRSAASFSFSPLPLHAFRFRAHFIFH